ncbi:hypothetical protein [Flavobacterium granuli]|uniref:Lipocalin-like domain-containing protein n=1 Tax=Flavobacterium granuli TaxID=280093 RepID=A0ABU1S158_9FLAO|nr:hypothetical protein [Flavobacterium granuli]MDR6844773.1 hypothetical protein [Flavobacterium granuli]
MKKHYLLIILFLCFYKNYGQEPIQEAYVSKTYVNVEDEWNEVNYSAMVNIASNRKGQLKITNAEFLRELSDGKANMVEKSAYDSAEFTSQTLIKEKTEKNGLLNLTYEGNLVFKTFDKAYTAATRIIFIVNQADIIGLKILNKENRKEYALDLTIKE